MVRATSSNVLRRITTLLIISYLLTVGLCTNTATFLLAFTSSCSDCSAAEWTRFHSRSNGYSFAIPETWDQIPDDVVRNAMNRFTSGGVSYEAGFQRRPANRWLQYPYVMVNVMPYSDFGINRQVDEREIEKLLTVLTGVSADYVTPKMLNPEVAAIVSDLAIGKIHWDSEKKVYVLSSEAEMKDVGKVVGQVFGHFGKHAIIQIVFSDVKANWNQSANDRGLIQGSFQFDPEAAYNTAFGGSKAVADSETTESVVEPLFGAVIAGLLLAVPASLIAIVVKRVKRGRVAETRDRMQSPPIEDDCHCLVKEPGETEEQREDPDDETPPSSTTPLENESERSQIEQVPSLTATDVPSEDIFQRRCHKATVCKMLLLVAWVLLILQVAGLVGILLQRLPSDPVISALCYRLKYGYSQYLPADTPMPTTSELVVLTIPFLAAMNMYSLAGFIICLSVRWYLKLKNGNRRVRRITGITALGSFFIIVLGILMAFLEGLVQLTV